MTNNRILSGRKGQGAPSLSIYSLLLNRFQTFLTRLVVPFLAFHCHHCHLFKHILKEWSTLLKMCLRLTYKVNGVSSAWLSKFSFLSLQIRKQGGKECIFPFLSSFKIIEQLDKWDILFHSTSYLLILDKKATPFHHV